MGKHQVRVQKKLAARIAQFGKFDNVQHTTKWTGGFKKPGSLNNKKA